MHCVTFGMVECFIFIRIGCGLPIAVQSELWSGDV